MNVTNIIYAILILGIMGGVFGIILAIASKIFYVPQDERLEPLCDCLPGANCGGCGYTGCTAYAQAIIDGKADLTKCAAGGPEAAAKMAEIMGVEVGEMTRMVAYVRCTGTAFPTAWPPPRPPATVPVPAATAAWASATVWLPASSAH